MPLPSRLLARIVTRVRYLAWASTRDFPPLVRWDAVLFDREPSVHVGNRVVPNISGGEQRAVVEDEANLRETAVGWDPEEVVPRCLTENVED